MQRFKSIYFPDFPAEDARRRSLTIAFGPEDSDLFDAIKSLSSHELRACLGHVGFAALRTGAESEGVTLNAFCLKRLRRALASPDNDQLSLLPPDRLQIQERLIDPIQVTFRGGSAEPLHDWYPYLEGYSPDFVEALLKSFAPDARSILDPFAGTGTTPLTAAREGRRGYYCELNPLLQFLIETKATVLAMARRDRMRLAVRVNADADDLHVTLKGYEPDQGLARAYLDSFGTSEFFPPETFHTVLKLRSWLDTVACTNATSAAIATVAVMAALIPSSHLIRRGDVRFRKGAERAARQEDLIRSVQDRMRKIAREIERLEPVAQAPLLVTADAKRLVRVPHLGIGAMITSPPYLNGTNYYRNTKVELWFLRAVRSGRDLAAFRRQTVTAGINDVTVGKEGQPPTKTVETVVAALEDHVYDRRIPQMVASYFAEMKQIFAGLLLHAEPRAPLVLDIGDSAYAGVRVDTPGMLAEILACDGWNVRQEVTLRERLSRNGLKLRQVLLVAFAPSRRSGVANRARKTWDMDWVDFKRDLPHQKGECAKRNWGSPLHSLCSYQGKMKPSLAFHLVKTFTKPGDRMVDPFGGVGTISFEAASNGVMAWSFDISPAAVPIAAAKLQPTTPDAVDSTLRALEEYIRDASPLQSDRDEAAQIRFNGPLTDYFHPHTLHEVLLARHFFKDRPPTDSASSLVFACLLHILHGNRPYALSRRSHPITPFAPSGPALYKSLMEKLTAKVERSLQVTRQRDFVPGVSLFQDASGLWPPEVDEIDAVITSPPFYDSTRFYLANWMRLWFAGWTAADFKARPLAFVDERQKTDFRVYEPVIQQARERLKLGGVCVFHLGRSVKCDMADEIVRIARPWFQDVEVFTESVTHCESHGIRDKGTVVAHTYVALS